MPGERYCATQALNLVSRSAPLATQKSVSMNRPCAAWGESMPGFFSRSRALPAASDRDSELLSLARELLFGAVGRRVRVRLIGVALERLRLSGEQLGLFSAARDARLAALFPAVDRLREKYGFDSIVLATSAITNAS